MFLFRCCVHQTADKKQDDPAEVVEIAATSVSRRMDRPKEGSVTTPGGSRRFGSFAGRFALASSNPTHDREMLDNYDLLTPEQLRNAARKMRNELDNLYKAVGVMNQLALELDINSAVDNIRDVVLELLHCERVTLFLVDSQQKELRARVANPEEHWEMIRVPFGVGIAGRVAESGTSMNIPDAYACGLFNPAIDRKTGFRTRNILCCPISDMAGNHVAVIQALNKKHTGAARGTVFSSLDESNLELFGVHLGNMLTKSCFHTAALAEKQRLAKLYEAFRRVNAGGSSLEQLVTIILKAVRNLVNSEHNLLLFVDNSRDQLWTKWTLGTVMDNKDMVLCVKMGEGLVGQAATRGEGMCCQAVSGRDIMPAFATVLGIQYARSVLIQPIRDTRTSKTLAVVVAIDKTDDLAKAGFLGETDFTPSDRDAMAVFAMEAASIISERSLEISFASALSTVSASGLKVNAGLEDVLQAQLQSYAGLEEIESIASTCSRSINSRGESETSHGAYVSRFSMSNRSTPGDSAHSSPCGHSLTEGWHAPRLSLYESLREPEGLQHLAPPHSKGYLMKWDLDITRFHTEDLVKMVYDIFSDSGVLDFFKVEERKIMAFIAAVCSHYHKNPYHNFCHVVYVLHTTYMMLMRSQASKSLNRVDQLVLLIAALCHDVDHDGHTNSFHIQTQTPLAQRYNDMSVMENHHCALTFAILAKRDCAILSHLEKPLRQEIRKLIISAIMATDMSFHFSLTTEFKNHAGPFLMEKEEDRVLLVKAVLHAADISNPVRPFHVNCVMSTSVHREFRAQVAEERLLGLIPALHMDAKDERVQCQLEINFIDCVVTPLWEHCAHCFPALQPCMERVRANRAAYAALATCSNKEVAQALSAAEQGEKDPLAQTSSTISLQLIMQSEAAGMFNNPMSGDEGHALLAATVAERQSEQELDQEAAMQQDVRQEAGSVDELDISHDQSQGGSASVAGGQPEAAVQKPKAHSLEQIRAEPPGMTGDSPHDAPGQMSGMHSEELVLSVTPILGSKDDLKGRND
ncbi:TPA: hypothetical protein ACH3X1_012787 [Trebouxia sp. C0004]